MNADLVIAWGQVVLSGLASVALVPIAIYSARYFWDVRRWTSYERLIQEWAQGEWAFEDLTDDDWKAIAATKLFESSFEPARVPELIEAAVWFAKGRASQEATGKIGFRKKG